MATIEEALKVIIAKSPDAASQAIKTIHAMNVKSPLRQHRYNATVDAALNDPKAEFTY